MSVTFDILVNQIDSSINTCQLVILSPTAQFAKQLAKNVNVLSVNPIKCHAFGTDNRPVSAI